MCLHYPPAQKNQMVSLSSILVSTDILLQLWIYKSYVALAQILLRQQSVIPMVYICQSVLEAM